MKQSLHRSLREKPLLNLRPLPVSLLLSLVVVLHSVSCLDKSFDEERAFGQKRPPVYKQGRKQELKIPKDENDKPIDELLMSLIEKYLKENSAAEKQHKLSSHKLDTTRQGSDCGVPDFEPNVDSRIVGGVEATPHSWPWQVALSTLDGFVFCGGSIFKSHWVITAAHCVTEGGTADLKIILGAHNKLEYEGTEQEFKVEKIIMHKKYDNNTMENDIALIRLSGDVEFDSYIKPICLPNDKGDDVEDGTICVATGWGDTQSTGDENVLNQVSLPVISNSQCNKPDWNDGSVKNSMICAGYPDGRKDACQGDSGGPLVSFSEDKWKLYGITSFGFGCADPQRPGVYTRVANYLQWIQKKTEQNK